MIPEHPSILELPSGPESLPSGRVDLLRIAVQGALALYLLPVILLVAGIGVVSIIVSHTTRWVAKYVGMLTLGLTRRVWPDSRVQARMIGLQPIAGRKAKGSRVIR